MKIIQLIQKPQPRGAETFAAQLSANLVKLGHSSAIYAIFNSEDSHQYSNVYQLVDGNPNSRMLDWRGWANLAKIIKIQKPDIIQANAGDTLKYAVFSKLIYKWQQPIVFRNASTLSSYIKGPGQKLYNKFLYNHVDAIASVSEHSRNDLVALFPHLSLRTVTIPIGLEEEKSAVSNPFRSDYYKRVNLVHVGGFTFEKNHQGLLRIFKSISDRDPDVRLWLVGNGPLKSEIEIQVKAMGLIDKVFFTGFVNNPLDYIASADVLLLPSIIEGLPGVILEAMLYRTPVVAYNVGGISEVIQQGRTGWLIELHEEPDFVDAVLEAIAVKKLGSFSVLDNAKELVRFNYMNSLIAAKFVNLYYKLVNK